ncbi:hypothetical protein ES332_D05G361200v1 [Gossypium tomentosum]|uniref:Prolyl 4-hydroxylase alpha subunit domain-containing protein n=1 Tax=Gossypium tomentosum TaxID=34277 RepID=A0A5D2L4A9_GOSTO|nr:hypothetical protein ES332_D05G361200v1 [Gossypium tomentosum]
MDHWYFIGFLLLILLHLCLVSAEINESVLEMKRGTSSVPFDPTRVTQLSWHPSEECNHLITLAKDKLKKSMVADNESGDSIESEVRTSFGISNAYVVSFISHVKDEVVADIKARIAAWTFLPAENGESIQILHYENGQKYEPHFDYFHDKANQELGGHRIALGGEIVFPNAEGKLSQPKDDSWSDCAKNGYAVKAFVNYINDYTFIHNIPVVLLTSCKANMDRWHPDSVLQTAASKSREFEAIYGKHRSKGSEDKLPMQSSLDEMVVFIQELISLTRLKTWEEGTCIRSLTQLQQRARMLLHQH